MPTPPFQTVSTWPGNKKFTRFFFNFPAKTDAKMGPIFGSTLNIILLGGPKNGTADGPVFVLGTVTGGKNCDTVL
jgi:hypothetical protein